jgi:hypothetical protein
MNSKNMSGFRNLPETEFVIIDSDPDILDSPENVLDPENGLDPENLLDPENIPNDAEGIHIGSEILPNGDEVITNVAVDLGTLPPEPIQLRQKFCALTYAPHLETRTVYVIVSGCFNTLQEAHRFCAQLHARDPRWNRCVGETGRPLPIPIDRRLFSDNPIVRGSNVPVVPFNIISENLDNDEHSVQSMEPVQLLEPMEPMVPMEPIESVGPVGPVETVGPVGPVENPQEPSDDNQSERSEEGSEEKSEEGSEEKSEERSEEKSEEGSEEKSEEGSEEKSEERSEEKSEEGSEEKSEERSEEKSEEGSEEKSEEGSKEKSKERSDEESEYSEVGSTRCVTCISNDRNSLFMPCRHLVFCLECAHRHTTQSNLCPICRTPIKEVMNVFL